MEDVENLLFRLKSEGIRLWRDGEVLRFSGGSLESAPLLEIVRARRDELLETLRPANIGRSARIGHSDRPFQIPASYAQERLWFLDQLGLVGAAYNMPFCHRLYGDLDVDALVRSVHELVRRHESLRTRFSEVDGAAVQIVDSSETFSVSRVDFSTVSHAERNDLVEAYVRAAADHPFDLKIGCLFRATLIKISDAEHLLLLTMHHIVSDGWSMGVIARELSALYEAFSSGLPSPLPDHQIQYSDYSLWQREWLQGDVLERQLEYWREQLRDAPASLELPTDYSRPAVASYRGAFHPFSLTDDLSASLKEFARAEEATLYMLLLAAFQVLLARWSGQNDVIVGSPVAGRAQPETEGLIGLFVNTVAMRGKLSTDLTFRDHLKAVKKTALEAYAHQDLPFEKLVAELRPVRDLSRQPIVQAGLVLEYPANAFTFRNLRACDQKVQMGASHFELTLYLESAETGLKGGVKYATDLFDIATIERFSTHFQVLLRGIVEDPNCNIFDLPLLDMTERRKVLEEWNDTFAEYPSTKCVHDLVAEQAKRTPNAIALIFEGRELSYGELDRQANHLAHHLCKLGVRPDVVVGLCVERSIEMIVALIGILKAGGAYLPLDPNYPRQRLEFMLEDARARILVTQESLKDKLDFSGEQVLIDIEETDIALNPGTAPEIDTTARNLAYVIYTSGSTGKPKGVMIEHRSVTNLMTNVGTKNGLCLGVRSALTTSLGFDASVDEYALALAHGATVVVFPALETLDPASFWQRISDDRINVIECTPSFLSAVLNESVPPHALSMITVGAEPVYDSLCREAQGALGAAPKIANRYGPTETTVIATEHFISKGPYTGVVPIGQPLANYRIYVLDERLNVVPIGVVGELYIGGVGLARGYVGRPSLTAERFIANPYGKPGDRIYRTGDLARWRANGLLDFIGRIDNQIKLRGFRIELGEIEVCLRDHPRVRQAVVLSRGTGSDQQLTAYVVTRDQIGAEELRKDLGQRLPEHMIPSGFVFLDRLPITANGKVDKEALSTSRSPIEFADDSAPKSEVEIILQSVWVDVLNISKIGVFDNFFAVGGHSLLAMHAVARSAKLLGVRIPLREMFEFPTIRALGQRAEERLRRGHGLALPRIGHSDRPFQIPASYAQERLWFLDQLGLVGAAYNMPFCHRLYGDLDVDALVRSVHELVRRHESLRTRFSEVDGAAVQIVDSSETFSVSRVDFSTVSHAERNDLVEAYVRAAADHPFDLKIGCLFRATLIKISDAEHLLLLTMHHIVSDGWSMGVIARELSALYEAFSSGLPSPLPDHQIQYSDYSLWQREWLQGDVLERQLEYWREQLRDAPASLELPTDYSRPAVASYRGAFHPFSLTDDLSASLKEFARAEEATLYMLLLAAFQVLLARWSGQNDVIVGSPVAGRAQPETEGLIGLFVNTVAMRGKLSTDLTFRDHLKAVKKTALEAYAHQDLPFEKLVAELRPVRDLSRQPIVQAGLVFQNIPNIGLKLNNMKSQRNFIDLGISKFEVSLFVTDTDRLMGGFEYATDLFDIATIERFSTHFQVLLRGIVEDPNCNIFDLPLLDMTERRKVLEEWNDTFAEYPSTKCVHDLVAEQAKRTPNAIALIFEGRELSYGELDRQANHLAHHLCKLGVRPDVVVGLCVERSIEMIVALIGILKAGGAYLPLDPNYPRQRLEFMLEDARAPVVIASPTTARLLPEGSFINVCLSELLADIGAAEVSGPVRSEISSLNRVYCIYTSGSTGRPKAVDMTHRALRNLIAWHRADACNDAPDIVLQFASLSFDVSFQEIFTTLCFGRTLLLMPEEIRESLIKLTDVIRSRCVGELFLPPVMFYALSEHFPSAPSGPVRKITVAGEQLRVTKRLWDCALVGNAKLINHYGPSETHVATSCNVTALDGPVPPIGRPISNTQVYVLNERFEPAPVGAAGEIYIAGDGVGRGYLNRPGLTSERFIACPFGRPGSRMYRTGDVGRWRGDGQLEFLGRTDHQIKVRGFRIEPGEIEACLMAQDGVEQAVVVAHKDSSGQSKLVAYVVATTKNIDVESLRGNLLDLLPEFSIPTSFRLLSEFPLTPSGKVNRASLNVPEQSGEAPLVEARGDVEREIARIWQRILNKEAIDVTESFFEMGGHSLAAMRVVAQIYESFGVEIPLRLIFEQPTIRQQAARIAQLLEFTGAGEFDD